MKHTKSRLVAVGTIFICAMAVLLSVFSVAAAHNMRQAASAIYAHPYTVSNAAREMRSRLLDMKQFIGIILTDSFQNEEETQKLLKERYQRQYQSIQLISEQYLGPEVDLERLRQAMEALVAAQDEAVRFASGHTRQQIMDYVERRLYPCYAEVSDGLTVILAFADEKIRSLEQQSMRTAQISTTMALFLSLTIILLALNTNRLLERKRRQEVAGREKLFDLLAANVDDVFFLYNYRENSMDYISANCERILGVDGRTLTSLTGFAALFPEEARRDLLLFSGPPQTQAETDFKAYRPGEAIPRWMTLKIFPIMEEGKATRVIFSLSDQTNRIQAEQNLRDALAVAQNANQAKQDFLSRMSHEIRTPMNAIIGMTAIGAAHLKDPARVEDCLAKISFSSRHLLSLINDVLDMSKIEEGKLTISHELFSFRQLIESVTTIIFTQAREHGLHFEAALTGMTLETLVGDSLRVNQILINLLSNAVKFTPAGGAVRLQVRQLAAPPGTARLRFTVSDTGIGMNQAFLDRLYMPFEQADSSISQKYGGTGLGMSITKNLVTLLGGSISVRSKEGQGTTFEVELPFGLSEDALPAPDAHKLQTLRVLLVDDDQDTCLHATLLLDNMGIHAKWVLSGAEAIACVEQAREAGGCYDVCFIDWQMPNMDGVETARRIREQVGPDTLIIILTAYDWGPIEQDARAAGVNAFIAKPVFASSLYDALVTAANLGKAAPQPQRMGQRQFPDKRILLVEDNQLNLEIAVELLQMTKVQVDTASNGQEAVNRVLAAPAGYYNLVLMDIQMPVLNGYDAARKIRASSHPDAASLPIIAMTANAFSEDVAAALQAGMNGHIAKPIDLDLLYKTLEQVFTAPAG